MEVSSSKPERDGRDELGHHHTPQLYTLSPLDFTTDFTLNNTLNNETNTTAPPQQFYRFYRTEQLTFLCVLFAFIVIGNVSVLVAILCSKTRKSRMNFFILHLAFADLCTGLIAVLTDILWKVTIEWHAGNVGCKLVRYLQCVATFASTYVLVALSIDRLDAIARPMNFSGSSKRAKALVCTAWGLALAFSIPMLVLNHEKDVRGMRQCWIEMQRWHWMLYVTSLAVSLYIVPAIIIAICYTVIVVIIWRKGSLGKPPPKPLKSRRFAKNGSVGGATSRRAQTNGYSDKINLQCKTSSRGLIPKAKIKTVKMTLVIVLVFIMCWSPYFVFDLLDVYGLIPMNQSKIAIATFIQSLAPLNSAANPVIYCLFSTRACCNLSRSRPWRWLSQKLCPCVPGTKYHRGHQSFSTHVTDCSSDVTRGRTQRSTSYASRRHSGSPYVKVTLNERENDILMQHMPKKSNAPPTSGVVKDECSNVT